MILSIDVITAVDSNLYQGYNLYKGSKLKDESSLRNKGALKLAAIHTLHLLTGSLETPHSTHRGRP